VYFCMGARSFAYSAVDLTRNVSCNLFYKKLSNFVCVMVMTIRSLSIQHLLVLFFLFYLDVCLFVCSGSVSPRCLMSTVWSVSTFGHSTVTGSILAHIVPSSSQRSTNSECTCSGNFLLILPS